jgi:hypothetical protein
MEGRRDGGRDGGRDCTRVISKGKPERSKKTTITKLQENKFFTEQTEDS